MPLDAVDNTGVNAESILEFQATLLSHQRFDEGATALASELALKLNMERVSIGLCEHGKTQVKAVSHSADIKAKHDALRKIAAAMDEAVEQSAVIVHPEITGSQPRLMLAHATLIKGSGNQACTIPLIHQQAIFGALTLERSSNVLFREKEIQTFENVATLLGPMLYLKWNGTRPWYIHIKEDFLTWSKRHFSRKDIGFKLTMYTLGAALLALLFIPMQYNVSAPARLEGLTQRALVAPENGYLQLAHVRPGDKVKAGQVLAEMAGEELQLEIRRWQSTLAQHENAYSAALAQSDRVQMVMNESKAQEARTQLELAEQKLMRSRILAPFDGVIIKGDLKQLLGSPVQRGDTLLIIAPAGEFRLILEVDERDIAEVHPKQVGKVALVSLPGKPLPFEILSITPAATTKEARNFFEVEGTIKATGDIPLRPGLEGVGKIKAGERPLIWKLTHRIVDWAKITFWKLGL
jgi:biotin carboxyl carrier protein